MYMYIPVQLHDNKYELAHASTSQFTRVLELFKFNANCDLLWLLFYQRMVASSHSCSIYLSFHFISYFVYANTCTCTYCSVYVSIVYIGIIVHLSTSLFCMLFLEIFIYTGSL